jgi:hypothetical protein
MCSSQRDSTDQASRRVVVMAPKGKQPKKTLPSIFVSEKDLLAAQQLLKGAEDAKRMRSNMSYWLSKQGLDAHYHNAPLSVKKSFFVQWSAEKLATEGKATTIHEVVAKGIKARAFEWISKKALISKFGEDKALAKIECNKLATRPDPDSGRADEWHVEYKLYSDTGGNEEEDTYKHALQSEKDYNTAEGAATAKEELKQLSDNMADNINPLAVKMETASSDSSTNIPVVVPSKQEDAKTFSTLKAGGAKQILRNVNEVILSLKEMFEKTKEGKYEVQLHDDVKKLISLAGPLYKKLELAFTQGGQDEAEQLALATNIDKAYAKFNEVEEWYLKFHPRSNGKKKARTSTH